jgi:uncharacterized protein with NRDE domain
VLARANARAHLDQLSAASARYNAFNLLAWDGAALHVYSSRTIYSVEISHGIRSVSNQEIDTPWPKVIKAKQGMQEILRERAPNREALFELLRDRSQPPDEALPDTGVGLPIERELAPIFVQRTGYGTRCSTLVTIDREGTIDFEERSHAPGGGVQSVVRERILPA